MPAEVFCAICGGGFCMFSRNPTGREHNRAPEFKDCPDEEIITNQNWKWTGRLRILGKKVKGNDDDGSNDAYITGVGYHNRENSCNVKAGDDPNVPPQSYFNKMNDSHFDGIRNINLQEHRREIDVYWNLDFPVHAPCLKIFRRAAQIENVAASRNGWQLCLNNLVTTMKHWISFHPTCLGVDYYELAHTQRSTWEVGHGYEPYLVDPYKISDLAQFPLRFKLSGRSNDKPENTLVEIKKGHDPFYQLPAEILEHLLNELSVCEVMELRSASFVAYQFTGNGAFWKRRLRHDMPYLWEINEKAQYPGNIDWLQVYKSAKALSYLKRWNKHRYSEHLNGTLKIKDHKYFDHDQGEWVEMAQDEITDYSNIDSATIAIANRRRVYGCALQLLYYKSRLTSVSSSSDSSTDVAIDPSD